MLSTTQAELLMAMNDGAKVFTDGMGGRRWTRVLYKGKHNAVRLPTIRALIDDGLVREERNAKWFLQTDYFITEAGKRLVDLW